MTVNDIFRDFPNPEDPQARLESSFIESFLAGKGYSWADLVSLPDVVATALRTEACTYASNKLAELETRSKLVRGLQGKD